MTRGTKWLFGFGALLAVVSGGATGAAIVTSVHYVRTAPLQQRAQTLATERQRVAADFCRAADEEARRMEVACAMDLTRRDPMTTLNRARAECANQRAIQMCREGLVQP